MKTLHKNRRLAGALCAVLLAGVASPSFAKDTLEIRNFVGTINWSNGPMSAEITDNAGETKIMDRSDVVIDGGVKKIDRKACRNHYGRFSLDWGKKKKAGTFGGYENLEDMPILNVTVPDDTTLIVTNSALFTTGKPDIGSAELTLNHCGNIELGDIAGTLALDSHGSADLSVGQTGGIAAAMHGSGDLDAGDSEDVVFSSHGSGDIDLGHTLSIEGRLHGSGDFSAGDVSGDVDLSSHGSGDVDLGEVDGDLDYSSYGSGDLEADSVTGQILELESRGSGDTDIGGGSVDELDIRANGSSSIEYDGTAKSANLRATGSANIEVDRVTGDLDMSTSGSGDIDIDSRN